MAEWEAAARAEPAPQRTPEPPPAPAKSSPRSSRPSGVAKAYVPKEDPHTPAIVVDARAVREGEEAAAAEEARRRIQLESTRSAQTMRARPGELDLDVPVKKRSSGLLVLSILAVAGGVALYLFWPKVTPPAEPAAETAPAKATTPDPQIPIVPSPEALPAESAQATAEAPAAAPTPTPEPVAEPLPAGSEPEREPALAATPRPQAKQPAQRHNAPPKKTADASPRTPAEPQKKAEGGKKNVIVRDAPF
jgi:hypothetical protein